MKNKTPANKPPIKAVLFDLLTALLDSWTVWNLAADSEALGRAWRAEYLRLTYGCGAYVPYEDLVQRAAANTGLARSCVDALHANWSNLPVWSGAQEALDELAQHYKLGVVTNCSVRMGGIAAARLNTNWDVVVTAEEAGFYKPNPAPYRLALERLGVSADEALFVAGSGYDLFGTAAVGLPTYWHNRVGLSLPPGAPHPDVEHAGLEQLVPWVQRFRSHDVKVSQ